MYIGEQLVNEGVVVAHKILKKKVKPELSIKDWKAMEACNRSDKDFVPLLKRLTSEKLKELQKLVKGE